MGSQKVTIVLGDYLINWYISFESDISGIVLLIDIMIMHCFNNAIINLKFMIIIIIIIKIHYVQ